MDNLINLSKLQNEQSYLFGLEQAYKYAKKHSKREILEYLEWNIEKQKEYIKDNFNN